MWKKLLLAILIAGSSAALAQTRSIAFYVARPVETAPVIDGKLDEACWQQADLATTYYEYWKPNPARGVLNTAMQIAYSERGLYIGITNFDEELDKLRVTQTSRDAAGLWQDDCAEFYVDASGSSIGYCRFVVNAAGVIGDTRKIDGAVSEPNWNGHGWQARTWIGEDAWTIEAFFPWSDLGRPAAAGDLWRFCHVRYAWTTGKFQGVTWSPGGSYARAEDFGYLYFADGGATLDTTRIGEILANRIAPPWSLPIGEGFLLSTEAGRAIYRQAADQIEAAWSDTTTAVANVNQELAKLTDEKAAREFTQRLEELQGRADDIDRSISEPLAAVATTRSLDTITQELDDLRWQIAIAALLATL